MKVDQLPFLFFLVLQCARFGIPLPSLVDSAEGLVPRNEFGFNPGEIAEDGAHPGNDIHGNTEGNWQKYEQTHGAEGAPVHPDDAPGSGATKGQEDASGASPHDETVEVNGVEGKYIKETDEVEIDCNCAGKARRRRDGIFQRNKGVCWSDMVPEVMDFNHAWGPVDKAAAETTQKGIKWASDEIIRRIKTIKPDELESAIRDADSSLFIREVDSAQIINPNFQNLLQKIEPGSPNVYTITQSPFWDPRISKIPADSAGIRSEPFSGLTFGPDTAGLKSPEIGNFDPSVDNTFANSPELPQSKPADLTVVTKKFTPAEFAQVYETQMQEVIARKDFTIQDQIDLQSKWLKLIGMKDPMDAVAGETGLVNRDLAVLQAKEELLKNPKDYDLSFCIWIDDKTYLINQPSKLSDSWWDAMATDRDANFNTPEGKAFKESYIDYIGKEEAWNRLGNKAEKTLEGEAKLKEGTLKGFLRKKVLGKTADPNAEIALSNKGMRIKAQGNKITVAGTKLTQGEKVAIGGGVAGGTAIVVVCAVDGAACQFGGQ